MGDRHDSPEIMKAVFLPEGVNRLVDGSECLAVISQTRLLKAGEPIAQELLVPPVSTSVVQSVALFASSLALLPLRRNGTTTYCMELSSRTLPVLRRFHFRDLRLLTFYDRFDRLKLPGVCLRWLFGCLRRFDRRNRRPLRDGDGRIYRPVLGRGNRFSGPAAEAFRNDAVQDRIP